MKAVEPSSGINSTLGHCQCKLRFITVSCSLIHHSPGCQVTVIEDELVVGAAGCHKVGHRLGSLEIVGFDHLWRESEPLSRCLWAETDRPTAGQR